MNPEQALQLLDAAASEAHLNRATHVQVQEATRILSVLLTTLANLKSSGESKDKKATN